MQEWQNDGGQKSQCLLEEVTVPLNGNKAFALIRVARCANMGCHIVKTTIEIADDLFERAQTMARKEKTTFRALTERGLRLVLKEMQKAKEKRLPPLVTFHGKGLTPEFQDPSWEKIRDEIYRGHGA